MAYLPFPPNWPLFTPKDKLGDWFANYAEIMELNIWLGSRIKSVEFIEQSQDWTVQIVRPDGNVRTIKPKHVVMATGHAGEPYIPTFPGQDGFKGTVYHGSQHQDASLLPDVAGKKVVVCGTGNSGHGKMFQDVSESLTNLTH
jgi:cation diffusion facilitator CzcD-associated flavoprotein CzcO